MVAIEKMVENIRYKAQILARTNKIDSAMSAIGVVGFAAGLLVALVLIVVPALLVDEVKKMADKKSPASGWPIIKGDFQLRRCQQPGGRCDHGFPPR